MKKVDAILKSFRKTITQLNQTAKEAGEEMEKQKKIALDALEARDMAGDERKKATRVATKLERLLDEDSLEE